MQAYSLFLDKLEWAFARTPTKRPRTNALGLRGSTRCVRDFCERVRVARMQLAIICERARNADSRTFETHYNGRGETSEILLGDC